MYKLLILCGIRFLFGYRFTYTRNGIYYLYSGYKYYSNRKIANTMEHKLKDQQQKLEQVEDQLYIIQNEPTDFGFELIDIDKK